MNRIVTLLAVLLVGVGAFPRVVEAQSVDRVAAPTPASVAAPASGIDARPLPASARAPSVVRGKQLFLSVGCVHCHGSQGQGSFAGARLAPDSLPAAALAQFIRATNPTMPAYSEKVLGDADVADIAAFLATIPPVKPIERIPALRDLAAPGAGR